MTKKELLDKLAEFHIPYEEDLAIVLLYLELGHSISLWSVGEVGDDTPIDLSYVGREIKRSINYVFDDNLKKFYAAVCCSLLNANYCLQIPTIFYNHFNIYWRLNMCAIELGSPSSLLEWHYNEGDFQTALKKFCSKVEDGILYSSLPTEHLLKFMLY